LRNDGESGCGICTKTPNERKILQKTQKEDAIAKTK